MTFIINESLFLEGFIWILLFPFSLRGGKCLFDFFFFIVHVSSVAQFNFSPLRWTKNSNSKDLGDGRTILSTNSHEKVIQHVFCRNQTHRLTSLPGWLQWQHLVISEKECRLCSECSALDKCPGNQVTTSKSRSNIMVEHRSYEFPSHMSWQFWGLK